jgi:hypothetical protein|tara:strand:- start:1054 stop:1233 length:180 start_codon:yes stop_codon:yes gene_type:complete
MASRLGFLGNLLEEFGEMSLLILEEFNLLFSLLDFHFLSLFVSLFDSINFRLEFLNFVL